METLHLSLCLLLWAAPADVGSVTPSPETLFHDARMKAYCGEEADALRDVRRFLEIYPEHPLGVDLALWAVRYLQEAGRNGETRSLVAWLDTRTLPRIFEGESVLLKTKSAHEEGSLARAPSALADVAAEDPLAGREALATLLDVARETGRADDAVRGWLEDFVRYYPDDRRAADHAGWVWDALVESGRVEEARELYLELSRRDGFPADSAWTELTDLAIIAELGTLDEVIARSASILNQLPPGPRRGLMAREMAHVLSDTGSFLALAGYLGTLAAEGRANAEEFSTLVELVEGAAESQESAQAIRESLPMRDLHHLLLVAHAREGDLEAFRRWTEQSLERWPGDATTYELAAALMARRGERDFAQTILLRGLRSVDDERKREEFEAALEGVRSVTDLVPLEMSSR